MAGQGAKHRGLGKRQYEQHVSLSQREAPSLAWPCQKNVSRPRSQRPAVWQAGRGLSVGRQDMKLCSINVSTWQQCAVDRAAWRLAVQKGVQRARERNEDPKKSGPGGRRDWQPQQTSPFT